MSLIIATGSNQGDSLLTLEKAIQELSKHFTFIASSRVYVSKAIEYEDQPDFFNQVLEFKLPSIEPCETMDTLLQIEKSMGRQRNIPKGPRTIDLDILFWGTESFTKENLTVPHPRWQERSFVCLPLKELPFYETLKKCFTIPKSFTNNAFPCEGAQ